MNKWLPSLKRLSGKRERKKGKKQSAHVESDKREWDEMAAGGSDGTKKGSKTTRMKFPSRDMHCPSALGNTLGKL